MVEKLSILAFGGSLREGSYNSALLRAAKEFTPAGAEMEIFDIKDIPSFNEDTETDPHPSVKAFKSKIRAADGILIATPEYNYSVPGFLKNAIDCASRPYGDNAFDGKPVAIMGASIGMLGTGRAQYHLRQSCVFLNMYPLNRPEVMVPFAHEKIDATGRFTDPKTAEKVKELVEELARFVKNHRQV